MSLQNVIVNLVQRFRLDDKCPWGSPERVVEAVIFYTFFSVLMALLMTS